MSSPAIPKNIQAQVENIVAEFNRAHFHQPERGYQAHFRGRFLYLDRCDLGEPFQVCRLAYQGKMDDWDFAIYRHSRERYDPEEWFFPGSQLVNGTIQGAMEAGLAAYPVLQDTPRGKILRTVFRTLTRRR
jgi:hypothetical protein